MSDNEINNVSACIADTAGRYGDFMVYFSRIWIVLVLLLIIASLGAWIWFRPRLVFLQKRSFMSISLVTIGLLGSTIIAPLDRSTRSTESIVHSCPLVNILFMIIIPSVVLGGFAEVLLFMTRASLYATLSKSLGSMELPSSKSEKFSHQKAMDPILRRKLLFASGRFNFAVISLIALLVLAIAVGITSTLCPQFGDKDVCIVVDASDFRISGSFFFPIIFGAINVFYVQRKLKTYPDPFYILSEVRNGHILGFFLAVTASIVNLFDFGNFEDEEKYEEIPFSFGVFIDLSFVLMFVYVVPYQIYKALRFNKIKALYSKITLQSVLDDKVGRNLFKAHLVSEFSLENLYFIEAVDKFKNTAIDNQTNKAEYMKNMFFTEQILNIRYLTSKAIMDKFDNEDISSDMFDDAYDEIWILVESDIYPRFQRTKAFEGYIGILNPTNTKELL